MVIEMTKKYDIDEQISELKGRINELLNFYNKKMGGNKMKNVSSCTTEKVALGKVESFENGIATIPCSKELKAEIKSLFEFRSPDERRDAITQFGVVDGFLCATNSYALKRIKIDGLEVFDNNACVRGEFQDDNLMLEPFDCTFPVVERVIPKKQKYEIVIDNKAFLDEIKSLEKIKYLSKRNEKKQNIKLIVKGGEVFVFDKKIGTAESDIDDFFVFNYLLLKNSLTQNETSLLEWEDTQKAVSISTESTDCIVMPKHKEGTIKTVEEVLKEQQDKRAKKANEMGEECIENAKENCSEEFTKVFSEFINSLSASQKEKYCKTMWDNPFYNVERLKHFETFYKCFVNDEIEPVFGKVKATGGGTSNFLAFKAKESFVKNHKGTRVKAGETWGCSTSDKENTAKFFKWCLKKEKEA